MTNLLLAWPICLLHWARTHLEETWLAWRAELHVPRWSAPIMCNQSGQLSSRPYTGEDSQKVVAVSAPASRTAMWIWMRSTLWCSIIIFLGKPG